MKIKRIATAIIAFTLIVAALVPISAMAVNHEFYFEFHDLYNQVDQNRYTKSDSEQRWYVTAYNMNGCNVSSSNILGVKMHHLESVGAVATYELVKDFKYHSWDYITQVPYSSSDHYYLGAKKDSSSTSTSSLTAVGVYCP